MELTNLQRAEVITQALPYIQKYHNKIIVVKYGGNAMISEELKLQVMEDLVLLWLIGVKPVLVHGGGPEISDMLKKVGKQSEFVDGLRVTDKETAEIVQMVLAGKINKQLVNLLGEFGGNAVGISGIDGHLIEAKVKVERLGFVGEITNVNVQPILDLIEKEYIPVVSTVGCDKEGNVYNINADTAAAHRYRRAAHGHREGFQLIAILGSNGCRITAALNNSLCAVIDGAVGQRACDRVIYIAVKHHVADVDNIAILHLILQRVRSIRKISVQHDDIVLINVAEYIPALSLRNARTNGRTIHKDVNKSVRCNDNRR